MCHEHYFIDVYKAWKEARFQQLWGHRWWQALVWFPVHWRKWIFTIQWCNILPNLAYNTCTGIKLCHCINIFIVYFFLFRNRTVSRQVNLYWQRKSMARGSGLLQRASHWSGQRGATVKQPRAPKQAQQQRQVPDRFLQRHLEVFTFSEKLDEKCAIMNTTGKW